jgi:hypothetical protein
MKSLASALASSSLTAINVSHNSLTDKGEVGSNSNLIQSVDYSLFLNKQT